MSDIFDKLFEVTPITWATLATIIILSLVGLVFLSHHPQPTSSRLHTKRLVYGGICISISFILSSIRLFHLPQGGSITPASMLPLVLYSIVFGPIPGILAGISYGFLQLIQDPSFVGIPQILLDYPLAFGCIGLAGIAPQQIKNLYLRTTLALTLAFCGRGMMHIISGVLFFAEYTPEGMSPLFYSISYNGSFLLVELIITLLLSSLLISTPVYKILKKGNLTSLN